MFCEKCGKEIDDMATFCSACGARVVISNVSTTVKETDSSAAVAKEEMVASNETEKEQFNKASKLDRLGFLALQENEKLKKSIDNNIKFTMIFIIIVLLDSIYILLCTSKEFGLLRLALSIGVLVQFRKLKVNLDGKLCHNLFLLSIFTLSPFLIYEFFDLKKNISKLDKLYEES